MSTLPDAKSALYSSDALHNTLLHRTTLNGQTQLAVTIASMRPELLKYINGAGEYPLSTASKTNQWKSVNHFSTFEESHLSMHHRDADGNTLLHKAVIDNQLQAIAIISRAQPSLVHKKNHAGQTPFFMGDDAGQWPVIESCSLNLLKVLLSRDKNGNTLLHQAIAKGKRQLVKDLVRLNPQLLRGC